MPVNIWACKIDDKIWSELSAASLYGGNTCNTAYCNIEFSYLKENEKAVDELRRFYSAQAAKHKENMEQAVNHKVLLYLGCNLLIIWW